jgi:hypothetical protein
MNPNRKFSYFVALVLILLGLSSCGRGKTDKTDQETKRKADSIKEQKNLDSLFNEANKNIGK